MLDCRSFREKADLMRRLAIIGSALVLTGCMLAPPAPPAGQAAIRGYRTPDHGAIQIETNAGERASSSIVLPGEQIVTVLAESDPEFPEAGEAPEGWVCSEYSKHQLRFTASADSIYRLSLNRRHSCNYTLTVVRQSVTDVGPEGDVVSSSSEQLSCGRRCKVQGFVQIEGGW